MANKKIIIGLGESEFSFDTVMADLKKEATKVFQEKKGEVYKSARTYAEKKIDEAIKKGETPGVKKDVTATTGGAGSLKPAKPVKLECNPGGDPWIIAERAITYYIKSNPKSFLPETRLAMKSLVSTAYAIVMAAAEFGDPKCKEFQGYIKTVFGGFGKEALNSMLVTLDVNHTQAIWCRYAIMYAAAVMRALSGAAYNANFVNPITGKKEPQNVIYDGPYVVRRCKKPPKSVWEKIQKGIAVVLTAGIDPGLAALYAYSDKFPGFNLKGTALGLISPEVAAIYLLMPVSSTYGASLHTLGQWNFKEAHKWPVVEKVAATEKSISEWCIMDQVCGHEKNMAEILSGMSSAYALDVFKMPTKEKKFNISVFSDGDKCPATSLPSPVYVANGMLKVSYHIMLVKLMASFVAQAANVHIVSLCSDCGVIKATHDFSPEPTVMPTTELETSPGLVPTTTETKKTSLLLPLIGIVGAAYWYLKR